jgi:hypothetical protein
MVFWPNLLSTKNVIWPKKNAHKVVWPKIHLTESLFDRKLFLSNDNFSKKKHSVTWPYFGKSFRSYELSVKWPFFEKAFGQINFRSCVILVMSVIWLFFQVKFSVKWPFSKYFRSNGLLINFVSAKWLFSVKWTFGQTAFLFSRPLS